MTAGDDEIWLDDAAGPLIRPYAVTDGRTSPTAELDLLSMVVTTNRDSPHIVPDPEHVEVLDLCRTPLSVAEVAALIRRPAQVAKILIADLVDWEAVTIGAPCPPSGVDAAVLQKVLEALEQLV